MRYFLATVGMFLVLMLVALVAAGSNPGPEPRWVCPGDVYTCRVVTR